MNNYQHPVTNTVMVYGNVCVFRVPVCVSVCACLIKCGSFSKVVLMMRRNGSSVILDFQLAWQQGYRRRRY